MTILRRRTQTTCRDVVSTVHLPRPHAAQRQVVVERRRFNVLQCGRRFGKTTHGIDQCVRTALDKKPAGWFAPTHKYLADAWRTLRRILVEVTVDKSETEKRLELVTGGVIECWSVDDPDAGRSRKYATVVVDEYAKIRDLQDVWTSIRPTLADYRGGAWFLGTPHGKGYAHTLFVRGQGEDPHWKSWRFGTVSNPFIAPDEVEDARRDMPPAAFDQEFLGIPADDAGNPFGVDAIATCFALAKPDELQRSAPAYWGIDLAKWLDWTVLIGLSESGRMCRLHRFQRPWRDTLSEIRRIVGNTPALMDSTGVGDPILEFLQEGDPNAPRPPGPPEMGASASTRRQAYFQQEQFDAAQRAQALQERAEAAKQLVQSCDNIDGIVYTATSKQRLMERLAVAIQEGIALFGDVVQLELESFEYQYSPRTRVVRYGAPEGLHDDCVNALALAVECYQTAGRNSMGRGRLLAV